MSQSTAYSYDDAGNQLTVTDRNSNTTSYTYDALNRRIMTTDALSNLTIHIYDPVGNLTMITDAKGNSTTYSYDALNRLLSETYADLTTRGFSYDAVGNMLTRTDQNGNTTAYIYDDLYRLTLRNYPGINDDSFTYDSAGRMLTAANANAAISYAYDNANRTLSDTLNGKATSYIYDIPNRNRTLTYPGGKSVVEEMNLRQRLNNIKEGLNTIVLYSYDAGDRLIARDYPMNTTSAGYTHNANNWTTNLTHIAGITPFTDFEYTFDNEGNRKYQKKFHNITNSEQYLYDSIYRVTAYKEGTLNISGTIPAPLTQTAYNYDAVGNRAFTNKDATITTYTSNNVNEYTAIVSGGVVFPLYDLNGNLTNDGTRALSFDYENRLTGVAPGAISYKYDPLGRRIEKNVAGTITRYYFDGSRVIEERDGMDVVAATYTFGSWIDEILTMDRGGNTYYYHQNSLGTVAAVTNSSGVVVERYEYDAYGNVSVFDGSYTPLPGSAIGNPYMFTEREYDPESGLYYYRARYYDPVTGRFIQRDPLGYVDGMNLYEYVKSNPINLKDPTGRKKITPTLVEDGVWKCKFDSIWCPWTYDNESRCRNYICGFTVYIRSFELLFPDQGRKYGIIISYRSGVAHYDREKNKYEEEEYSCCDQNYVRGETILALDKKPDRYRRPDEGKEYYNDADAFRYEGLLLYNHKFKMKCSCNGNSKEKTGSVEVLSSKGVNIPGVGTPQNPKIECSTE